MAGGSSDDILAALNTNSGLATAAFLAILLIVASERSLPTPHHLTMIMHNACAMLTHSNDAS